MDARASTVDVLNRGMESLVAHMDVVDVERFIFLVKEENFDYTKWQRQYFSAMTKEQIDKEMDDFFARNPHTAGKAKTL